MSYLNGVSLLGLVLLVAFAWALSADRRSVSWRVVAWALVLQAALGLFIFQVPLGGRLFAAVNHGVEAVLRAASAGAYFVFGPLAVPPGTTGPGGESSPGFILAFQAFPTIIFFSALMSVLYFLNLMPRLIRAFARLFARSMSVSGAESLCAASNIFVGVESMLTVRPYLERMTPSELCTVLAAGMATVASNVLGFYVLCLRGQFPGIAGHLVSASLLSAPAAVAMAKVLLPESGKPETLGVDAAPYVEREDNVFGAVITGANAGLKLVGGIVALLVAVLGLVGVANAALAAGGAWVNARTGWSVDWSIQSALTLAFYPFAWALGVTPADVPAVARLVGERVILTEVPAYRELATLIETGALADPRRSAVLATYALCGFAHVASLGIFVGGAAALAPSRATELARVAPRALLAATLACLMTGCIAGAFYTPASWSLLVGR